MNAYRVMLAWSELSKIKQKKKIYEKKKKKEEKLGCFMFIYISELLSPHPVSSPTFLIYRHPI